MIPWGDSFKLTGKKGENSWWRQAKLLGRAGGALLDVESRAMTMLGAFVFKKGLRSNLSGSIFLRVRQQSIMCKQGKNLIKKEWGRK